MRTKRETDGPQTIGSIPSRNWFIAYRIVPIAEIRAASFIVTRPDKFVRNLVIKIKKPGHFPNVGLYYGWIKRGRLAEYF
jgi:hypothetical protein